LKGIGLALSTRARVRTDGVAAQQRTFAVRCRAGKDGRGRLQRFKVEAACRGARQTLAFRNPALPFASSLRTTTATTLHAFTPCTPHLPSAHATFCLHQHPTYLIQHCGHRVLTPSLALRRARPLPFTAETAVSRLTATCINSSRAGRSALGSSVRPQLPPHHTCCHAPPILSTT